LSTITASLIAEIIQTIFYYRLGEMKDAFYLIEPEQSNLGIWIYDHDNDDQQRVRVKWELSLEFVEK